MPKEPASGSLKRPPQQIDPDQRELQDIQAKRLAELSGLSAEKLKGRKLKDLMDELRWRVDPHLLLFRRVCGQVVKRNPATGELEGVPNATVYVEDTDCSFHIYSPPAWSKWSWFFPFKCKREVIATTHTDECGHFCVWIPRWDIDWVIKWRKGRICFPNFYRLRLRDYLERILKPDLTPEPPRIRPPRPPEATPIPIPIPRPEPNGSVLLKARMTSALRQPDVVGRLREVASETVANRLASLAVRADFGAESKMLDAELETPVIPLPPPVPERGGKGEQDFLADLREKSGEINFNHWIGPFRRCVDITFGVWTPVFDVPDITFKVTQDVDGDGTEEVIYSEGFFDVRWDEGPMADVIIEAFANAVSSPICEGPQIGECPKPAIVTAGLMSLLAPHFDLASGYAQTVNRPRAGGISGGARAGTTTAPMWSTVQLHGCHRFPNAAFYRIMHKYGGAGSFQPILGETWWAPRLGGGAPILIAPDASGWYPVLPAGDLVFPHWLLNWQTWLYANGRYDLQLELGNAAKAVIDTSAAVPIQVDNTRPNAAFTLLRWRILGGGGWTPLPDACPVIRRPAGTDIEIEVSCETSAVHFRNALLWGAGCDGIALAQLDSADKYDRWHTGPADNSWATTGRFLVAGSAEDGAYTFGLDSHSRAFNPAGGDSGPSTNWDYDPVYSWTHIRRHVAIVDL